MNRGSILPRWMFAALLWLVATGGAAAAAENVPVRAWAHSAFGRIVFDWNAPVEHTAEIKNRTLVIRFSRPIATEFSHVENNLYDYIERIALGGDGRTVTARLKGPWRMRSFVNEGDIVVDLAWPARGGSWGQRVARENPTKPKAAPVREAVPEPPDAMTQGAVEPKRKPPSVTPETAARPANKKVEPSKQQARDRVRVRTGRHAGFRRLVFDWKSSVDYRVDRQGRKATIRFQRPATVDQIKIRRFLAGLVPAVDIETTSKLLRLAFELPKGARLRHFRDGTRVVLDILTRAPTHDRAARRGPIIITDAPPALPLKEPPKKGASGRPVSLTDALDVASKGKDIQSKPRKQRRRARKARKKPAVFGPKGALVTAKMTPLGTGGLQVRFDWRRETAAAVYVRDGFIWVYFEKPTRVDLGGIRILGADIVRSATQYPVPNGSLIRLAVPQNYYPRVSRSGLAWNLDIVRSDNLQVAHPIRAEVQAGASGGPRVFLPASGARGPYWFHDPEVGDVVGVVPMALPGHGVAAPRRFVDVTVFASAQGLAFQRVSERLDVAALKAGVVITGPKGLKVSSRRDLARKRTVPAVEQERILWNIGRWRQGPYEKVEAIKTDLIAQIIEEPPEKRNAARMRLAKFYLAHGLASDAIGVIDVVMRQRPNKDELLTLRSLRAAAAYLMGHYSKSEQGFEDQGLKGELGTGPWRAGIAAARGNWRQAHEIFQTSGVVVARYPEWLRRRFNLLAAEAALVSGSADRAQTLMAAVRLDGATPEQADYLEYLRGFVAKKSGDPGQAIRIWKPLLESDHRRVRAKAGFATVEALLERKKITRADAIDRLEQLSFAWRGGDFEFDLLGRLGEMYIAENRIREGLIRLRQAVSFFKGVDGADHVAKSMGEHFKKLYIDGGADAFPPVTALALFEEFRELTPTGPEGDVMIQRLVNRLVDVDLLEQAAGLLQQQIEFRLKGGEKARVATRLARILRRDGRPKEALKALRDSEVPALAPKPARERMLLAARTLGDLGETEKAMASLRGIHDKDVERVRADLYRRNGQWLMAANTIQRSFGFDALAAGDEAGAQAVLEWAVALAMLGDDMGLAVLRDRFGEVMEKSSRGNAFRVIAGRSLRGIEDYRQLIDVAGDIGALREFVAKVKKLAPAAGAGAAN